MVPVSYPVRHSSPLCHHTNLHSVFAAKAGAKHVYAIEASGLAGKAREIIKRNGFSDIVT